MDKAFFSVAINPVWKSHSKNSYFLMIYINVIKKYLDSSKIRKDSATKIYTIKLVIRSILLGLTKKSSL